MIIEYYSNSQRKVQNKGKNTNERPLRIYSTLRHNGYMDAIGILTNLSEVTENLIGFYKMAS